MNAHDIEKTACPRCFALLDGGDRFCPHCGAESDRPSPQPPTPAATPELVPDRPKPPRDLAESRVMVLLLLFAVLGPLALPVLWRSSRFSGVWKVFLTALVLVFTVVVVWGLWYAVNRFVESLEEYGLVRTF